MSFFYTSFEILFLASFSNFFIPFFALEKRQFFCSLLAGTVCFLVFAASHPKSTGFLIFAANSPITTHFLIFPQNWLQTAFSRRRSRSFKSSPVWLSFPLYCPACFAEAFSCSLSPLNQFRRSLRSFSVPLRAFSPSRRACFQQFSVLARLAVFGAFLQQFAVLFLSAFGACVHCWLAFQHNIFLILSSKVSFERVGYGFIRENLLSFLQFEEGDKERNKAE